VSPQLSPDGGHVAYVQSARTGLSCKGCPSSIWVAGADASHPRQLTHPTDAFDASPSWSPDGGEIVFSRSSASSPPELLVVPAAGGPIRRLHVSGSSPAWGPTRIAYLDGSAVWTAAPDGSDPRRVGTAALATPAWSRDGTLAYVRQGSPPMLVELTGASPRRIPLQLRPLGVGWSPDGRSLVLTGRAGASATPDMYVIDADGRKLRRLTSNLDVSSASWR
jgi:Tol biopolymer transport system component